jgi:predicted amidohydrolase YtcJ
MKVGYLYAVAVLFAAWAWALASCGPSGDPIEPADLVLRGGAIATMDEMRPMARALAARDGSIVAVGDDEAVAAYVGDGTRVIVLDGMLAVPGLIEGHGHYMSYGASLMELDLRDASDWDEIVDRVELAVADAEPGEWIVGRGWHQDKWETKPSPSVEGLPTHGALSAISPENPVFLSHTSGHGVFVNAAAMAASGITRSTMDPEGGEIVRDADGAAIGMLRESAADPAREALAAYRAARPPEVVERELREQVRLAAEDAIRNGITSFQDMGSTFETIDLLKKMASEGALPLRLYVAVQEPADVLEKHLAAYRMVDYGDGYLTVRAIGEKVLDGALGTHGGWLLEPYTDLPRSSGFNVTPVTDIERSAELAIEHGYQMAIQGIGDKAARVLFDIYERELEKNPDAIDHRFRIEHAQVIHPDDLPRFAKLGVIAGIQGIFACSDGPWVVDRLGEERTRERGYIYRSMIDSGAVVMNGTDPPVEPIDPLASIHCSVTRELPDGTVFNAQEAMTIEEALRSYTINNAYAAFEEDSKGSLVPGKLADITVISENILELPPDAIREASIAYTIIGGEVRYENEELDSSGSSGPSH